MTYEVNGFYYNDESFEMEPAKVIIHNVSNAKEAENIAKEKYNHLLFVGIGDCKTFRILDE